MNEKPIAQLEARLENLVESAFAQLFRKRVSAHDIALHLVRSIEDNLRKAEGDDPRPLAPDEYVIHLHPDMQRHLQHNRPDFVQLLADYIVEAASQANYRLVRVPIVKLLANNRLSATGVSVVAKHTTYERSRTAGMQPQATRQNATQPQNPQLIINGTRIVKLEKAVINIGRSHDNDVILDDPSASRHHVQIRLRFGVHTLFDVNSRGGTHINGEPAKQHALRAGDVIQIGGTQIIYMVDAAPQANGGTAPLDPNTLDGA